MIRLEPIDQITSRIIHTHFSQPGDHAFGQIFIGF